jgi:MoaA/NifB/PqqE/SkfB family radical SAM enzyme
LIQGYSFNGDYELVRKLTPLALKIIDKDNILIRNKLLNELETAERKTILFSRPRRLTVTLSNRCNLSCIMCLTRYVKWDIPRKVVEEIYSLFPYLEKIMWQGGEVFYLDFFEELLSEGLRYPGLRHSIVTNGQLIREEMAERLVKNNVELTISVDGVTKEVYEYIRKGADFERIIRNLELILELKKRHKSNMILNLNVAVMKSNYHQLEDFIEFARKYGFDFVCIMPINIHLKTPEDIFTNKDMNALAFITEASQRIENKAKEYGLRLENRLPRLNHECSEIDLAAADRPAVTPDVKAEKLLCHIPWQQLLIDYDGSVRPDCLCKFEKRAGSLLEGFSLEEIWNNETMMEYRRRLAGNGYSDFCNPLCFSGKISESHFKIP